MTSFLAGGRKGELVRKLVLILKMLLFLPGNTSSLQPNRLRSVKRVERREVRKEATDG